MNLKRLFKTTAFLAGVFSLSVFAQESVDSAMVITEVGSILQPDSALETKEQTSSESSLVYTMIVKPGIFHGVYSKGDGPILIDGSIVVPAGQVLEFGPGITLFMASGSEITVYGEMRALGTRDEPIRFISNKETPQAGDWNRIYLRSRSASVFRNCQIKHSVEGLVVENGYATIDGCIFERNLRTAIDLKNAEVKAKNSTVRNGHPIAVFVQNKGIFIAESLSVRDNSTALLVSDGANVNLSRGMLSRNQKAVVLSETAALSVNGTLISKNHVGIITAGDISKAARRSSKENGSNVRKVKPVEIFRFYGNDSKVVTALKASRSADSTEFRISQVQDESASFIGNVTTGFSYYQPLSLKHPVRNRTVEYTTVQVTPDSSVIDSTVSYRDTTIYQNRYPGEQSDRFYAGLQPELQVFASGKNGGTDVNLLMDLYGNQWLSTNGYIHKNIFNLSLDFKNNNLSFGDFYESGSEISMSGRQMTGIRYTGSYWDMGAGNGRFEFRLAAGETEISKDVGDHELNIYNVVVDSSSAARQQVTYVLAGLVRPTKNSHFSVRGIISRDQIYKPLFRSPINDVGAPEPIQAQTGLFEGGVQLMGGLMEVFAELDLGNHDTIPSSERDATAWYNPEIEEAVPKVFSLLNRNDFSSHSAFLGGVRGFYSDMQLKLTYMEVTKDFFSAGNPYLETDKRSLVASAEKEILENLNVSTEYEYEKVLISENPEVRNSIRLASAYSLGENLPELTLDYYAQISTSDKTEGVEKVIADDSITVDSSYRALDLRHLLSAEGRQTFKNGTSYSLRYQLLIENDMASHPDAGLKNEGDELQHQLSGSFQMRLQKLLRNRFDFRLSTKDANRDSLQGINYRLADQLTIDVIPRKLTVSMAGDYSKRVDQDFSTETRSWNDPVNTIAWGGESEARYTVNSKFTVTLKGRYEKSYDELPGSAENYILKMGALRVTCLF